MSSFTQLPMEGCTRTWSLDKNSGDELRIGRTFGGGNIEQVDEYLGHVRVIKDSGITVDQAHFINPWILKRTSINFTYFSQENRLR